MCSWSRRERARCGLLCTSAKVWSPWIRFLLQSCRGGRQCFVILDNSTLKLLGIDVYDSSGARAREHAGLTGVDTAAYRHCRRIIVSVDALEKQTRGTLEEPVEAVGRLVARMPDIDMSPEE